MVESKEKVNTKVSYKETPKNTISYKIQYIIVKCVIWSIERIILLFIKDESFVNPEPYSWTKKLEQNTDIIREDFLRLWNEGVVNNIDVTVLSEEQLSSVDKDKWYAIPFYIWGTKFSLMHELAPRTGKLLEDIPDITTAFFSILKPGAVIKPHSGVVNGYIRYHLGIIVPEDYTQLALQVRETKYHWREGESMMFDHRHQHQAWNKSNEMRVVLLIDTIRPLPAPLRWFMILFTKKLSKSPYAQNMLKHLEDLGHSSKVDYLYNN